MSQSKELEELKPISEKAINASLDSKSLQWKGVSLRRLGQHAVDPDFDCIPFEQDGPGWKTSRWVGQFHHQGDTYSINPRVVWPSLRSPSCALSSME